MSLIHCSAQLRLQITWGWVDFIQIWPNHLPTNPIPSCYPPQPNRKTSFLVDLVWLNTVFILNSNFPGSQEVAQILLAHALVGWWVIGCGHRDDSLSSIETGTELGKMISGVGVRLNPSSFSLILCKYICENLLTKDDRWQEMPKNVADCAHSWNMINL